MAPAGPKRHNNGTTAGRQEGGRKAKGLPQTQGTAPPQLLKLRVGAQRVAAWPLSPSLPLPPNPPVRA
ncbi:hypothetical protein SKAU_G00374680 [Synaphobranchus kaupii]|uniref:Uncharacterized protein n=1 Tax=Synaphobranchus kaupii TaxID=118154 RepID=A0A9Q1EGR6_SYNKA|nr:hypothetical protein SKAU_G00374680 [Synaphobranchus kaupii]